MKTVTTTITFLFSLNAATQTASLRLHSPVVIKRPLEDVHNNCEQDVNTLCNSVGDLQYLHEEINVSNTIEEVPDARRRLVEENPKTVSRKVSFSLGIQFNPRGLEKSTDTPHSKNSQRFLNFGKEVDTCLWNAFDAGKVSDMCSSALSYLNDTEDALPYQYERDSNHDVRFAKISISFSGGTLLAIILFVYLAKQMCNDSEDNDDDDIDSEDNSKPAMDEIKDGYQLLDESREIAFVAVPVQIV